MAPTISTTPTSTDPAPSLASESIRIRSRNPIPLTAGQEQEVRNLYYKNVRSYCADEIRGRTFSIPFVCRQQRLAMEKCMNGHATREEEDKAREEWFATLGERRRTKEEEERWKEEQRKLKKEWWKDYVQK